MQDELLIAELISTHGLGGEFEIRSYSGEYDHIRSLDRVILQKNNLREEQCIESLRGSLKKYTIKFSGINNLTKAEKYTASQLIVQREKASPLAKNEYYYADLEKCRVLIHGTEHGKVRSVWENAGQDMLELELNDRRVVHVPLIEKFVDNIQIEDSVIEMSSEWILQ